MAIAAFNNGKAATAMDYLENSIAAGMEEGYITSFTDEMEPMGILLASFTAREKKQRVYVEYLHRRSLKAVRSTSAENKKAVLSVP